MKKKEKGITKESVKEIIEKNNATDSSKKFHEDSKITRRNEKDFEFTESYFSTAEMIKNRAKTFMSYVDAEEVLLTVENIGISKSFFECVSNRRSNRSFTGESIDLKTLSSILWHSYGLTGLIKLQDQETKEIITQFLRAVPSGGALYPIEVYISVINVEGLMPGFYHYNVEHHSIEQVIASREFLGGFMNCFTMHPYLIDLKKTCVVIVLTSMFWRQNAKYGSRGYRYALMEAGHLGQNIQLSSVGLGLGSVCLCGFFDDELNKKIGIDGEDETVVYAVAVGIPAEDNTIVSLTPDKLRVETL